MPVRPFAVPTSVAALFHHAAEANSVGRSQRRSIGVFAAESEAAPWTGHTGLRNFRWPGQISNAANVAIEVAVSRSQRFDETGRLALAWCGLISARQPRSMRRQPACTRHQRSRSRSKPGSASSASSDPAPRATGVQAHRRRPRILEPGSP